MLIRKVSFEFPAQDLAHTLRASISGEVRFDAGSRAVYATDGSNYRQVPIGVVIPTNTEDVTQTVALCRHYQVPLLPRGGGTSLAGQTCNTAVVLEPRSKVGMALVGSVGLILLSAILWIWRKKKAR